MNKTIINLSIICCKSYNQHVLNDISELETKAKIVFAAKLWDSKTFEQLRINPGNWRWNPLPNYAGWSNINRSDAGRIWQIWNFLTDATAETKIFLDKICFLFCQENSCFVCFCEKALCEVKFEFWAQSVVELSAQYLFGILKWDKCHKTLMPKISLVILFTVSHRILKMLLLRIWYWIN